MNELFGLSMTYIMIALLVVLAIALAAVSAGSSFRNRVMFFIGLRNIPRRRAQTVLIIIGLMLSTLIISTAFSIGDTVDYSITSQALRPPAQHRRGRIRTGGRNSDDPFETSSVVSARPIPDGQATTWPTRFTRDPMASTARSPLSSRPVPVSDERAGQTEPLVLLAGAGPDQCAASRPTSNRLTGEILSLSDLLARRGVR